MIRQCNQTLKETTNTRFLIKNEQTNNNNLDLT